MDIQFTSFVFGLLGFFAFWTWGTSTDGFCSIEYIKSLATKEGTNCLEVIVYRYQTLFTGLLAVTAAVITAIVYYYQLKEMKKQNNFAAKSSALGRYDAALARLKQLPNIDEVVSRTRRMIVHSATIEEGTSAYDLHMSGSLIWKLAERAGEIHNQIVDIRAAYTAGPAFIQFLDMAAESCENFIDALSKIQRAIIKSRDKSPITDDAANRMREDFTVASNDLSTAIDSIVEAHTRERASLEDLLIYLDRQITGQITSDAT